ncbi:APC family permease [Streptomyces sp. FH025]|uniref:APC family permease n=1 Tax=Streptomyces sp. FH025 TaxID=2815937 RepID=UPI001A9EABFF|nr:APC family permease [Streptomyces sp. FH025]MBO1415612.1 APC family permease [Streptomyces sp. FH025]
MGPEGAADQARRPSGSLKPNALGVLGIVFFVLSAQAPLTGIAGAAPIAIALGSGPGTPAAYLAAGALVLLFSVGYVAMSRHVVDAGAFAGYIGRGLGDTAGTGSAGVALFAYNAVQAAMYGLYGSMVSGLFARYLGWDVPWWACVLATMAVVQLLGAAGIEMGAKVLAVFVLAEVSILLAFGVLVLVRGGGPEGLAAAQTFSPSAALGGAPGVALMFALASMLGFEATAIYGEEAREPRKTIPRATYLAVSVITLFFAFATWMLVSAYGPSKAVAAADAALEGGDASVFVFAPIAERLGAWTGDVLPFLLVTSLFAGILAFHNSANRYLFSLGRRRLLPGGLSRLNRRHSPGVAGAVQTAIALAFVMPFALAGKDPVMTLFSWGSGVAVLAIMLMYFLTSVSVIVFFRRERLDDRVWNTVIAPSLGVLGIAAAIWLIVANFTTLIGGEAATATVLAAAVPLVFLVCAGLSRLPRARTAARIDG